MLTHPTLDQLHQLGLAGMARAFTELEANPRLQKKDRAAFVDMMRNLNVLLSEAR